LRIAYLVNSRWPKLRGAERLLLGLLEHARAQGHEVCVFATPESALHKACAEIGVRSEPVEFNLAPSHVWQLRSLLRELQPDVVHGMSIFPVAFVRGLRLVPDKHARFFAYVSTDPTSALPVATSRFRGSMLFVRNAISRREAPRLDAIFTASKNVAEKLNMVGIRGRIVPIPGHIDADRLVADAALPLDLPQGSPRVGFVGYLEPLKGIDDLIRAFAQLVPRYPAAVLLVAGEGPDRERLLDLATSLGIADRVTLLGYLDPVSPMLSALDVFASASHSEALGTSILEAMALGVPCVCTDSGGPAEIIRDGEDGLLVPVGDEAALAAAIERLIRDEAFASQVGERGRHAVCDGPYPISCTLETVFAEYERAARRAGDAA
jgi:glycosyltransferase involved in cell wall biosynthesis